MAFGHGLQTPNVGINQRNLTCLGRMWQTNMLLPWLKIWVWVVIFVSVLQAIIMHLSSVASDSRSSSSLSIVCHSWPLSRNVVHLAAFHQAFLQEIDVFGFPSGQMGCRCSSVATLKEFDSSTKYE